VEELDVEAFRSWLEVRREVLVGKAVDVGACPIARWLSEMRGGPWYAGPSGCYLRDDVEEVYAVPEWVSRFITAFDHRYVGCGPVNGTQALEMLNEVAPQ
jgi:hypothetical protein